REYRNLALEQKVDGFLPMDNLEGIIRRVEKQRLFHWILNWIVPDAPPGCQANYGLKGIGKRRLAGLRTSGSATDILRVLMMARMTRRLAAGLVLSVMTAACASSGAVPRPF